LLYLDVQGTIDMFCSSVRYFSKLNRTGIEISDRGKMNKRSYRHGKAAETFQQGDEKYRLFVENAGMPMVYYALDGRFLFINTFAAQNLGGKPEDFVGKSLYEIVPDLTEEIQERNRKMVELGTAQKYEDVIEVPSGTRWYSTIAQPLKDKYGKVFAIQVISYDITELKQQENAMNTLSDEFAEAAVESIEGATPDKYENLTPREREVFQLTAMGYDRAEISERLFISPRTAEAHRASAMRKLGLRSRIDLIRYALRRGIVPLEG